LKPKHAALLAVLVANMIFGINFVVAKSIMPDFMLPRAIIFIRVCGAAIIFWFLQLFQKKEKVSISDLGLMAIASVLGIAMNQIMFFEGLNLSTPINSSIIMVGVPINVILFSWILRGETLDKIKILGIILGTIGAVSLIIGGGTLNLSRNTMLGNLLNFINASSYALFMVLIKPMMMKYRPLTVMRWVFLFGALVVIPFTAPVFVKTDFHAIPWNIWLNIAYIILFTTVIAYFLNNYSLVHISPTTNSAFIYIQPVIAGTLSILSGKDQLRFHFMIPAILIFTGVYLVSIYKQADSIDPEI